MLKCFSELWRSRAGNFALTSAILLPILALAVGMSVDVGNSLYLKSHVQVIADAAALAGVAESVIDPNLSWDAQRTRSVAESQKYYNGALDRTVLAQIYGGNVNVTATNVNNSLTINVCYSYKYKPYFQLTSSIKELTISGCASALQAEPRYIDTYFVVDASGSMGIGATDTDQKLMVSKLGCAFACHTQSWLSTNCTSGYIQTTKCAHQIGATLRFDVVKSAIKTLVANSDSLAKVASQFRFGLYKFSTTPTKITDVLSDTGKFNQMVTSMDPDAVGAGTNLRYAVNQIAKSLPASGDGRTATTPQIFVIIVTDGVEGNVNEYNQNGGSGYGTYGSWSQDPNFTVTNPGFWNGSERSQAVDPTICQVLKQKNINVGTLHAQYLVPAGTTDYRFVNIQKQLVPGIMTSLQACASSPDFALVASSPTDIQKATQKIFAAMVSQARLTR